MWNMAFPVAIPLNMSAYVWIAGKVARIVREGVPAIAGNLQIEPVIENVDAIVKRQSG